MLGRFKKAAKDGALLLFYFDEAGCSGSPPTQRSWSKVGYPHRIAPAAHCRRNVLGALEFGAGKFIFEVASEAVRAQAVCDFLRKIAQSGGPSLDGGGSRQREDSPRHSRKSGARVAVQEANVIVVFADSQPRAEFDRDRLEASQASLASLQNMVKRNHRTRNSHCFGQLSLASNQFLFGT